MSTESFNFDAWVARMTEVAKERDADFNAFLVTQQEARPCARHQDQMLKIDAGASRRASMDGDAYAAIYATCPRCQQERKAIDEAEHLHNCGVPKNLLHCAFENWTPRTDADAEHLQAVMAFVEKRAGFLIMLGNVGTGKTHLSVAAMRSFRSALLVKQSSLLRKLRDTYGDRQATDPIDLCQDVGLLVLDEMGVSAGGREELPMIHEILDHRHGERKPTILTSNLGWEELKSVIGDRMADRIRESAFAVLNFAGSSRRMEARERYIEA